jgi:hypothetical protein
MARDEADNKTIDLYVEFVREACADAEADPAAQSQGNTVTEQKRGRGRPRKHKDNAAKQRAYRERLHECGKRQLSRIVEVRKRQQLESDVIDLSAVWYSLRR